MVGWLIYDRQGRERNGWFIEQLTVYAEKRGVTLKSVSAEELEYGIVDGKRTVRHTGEVLPDFALVRTIAPRLSLCLESCGVRTFNSALCSEIFNDKWKTTDFCASLGIQTADTFSTNRSVFDPLYVKYPCVVKALSGHGGSEVFLVHNAKEAQAALQKIGDREFLYQEVVDYGRDVRVYVLDGQILCAVERTSKVDFRSNFSLGGEVTLFEPTASMKEAVGRICDALHPCFVGIDFTFKNGQPVLNEIEDVVGTRMLYKLTDFSAVELYFDKVLEILDR